MTMINGLALPPVPMFPEAGDRHRTAPSQARPPAAHCGAADAKAAAQAAVDAPAGVGTIASYATGLDP
ncbi:hypothetical protein SSAG_00114 [Streptomyces sp. Mg1]|nr:hypothetical protein SSAG_00114 [Streptomyces sp. Mg1]